MKTFQIIALILFSLSSSSLAAKNIKLVKNVKEFFQAIDDHTEIIIQCDTLNFTLENLERELGIKETDYHWASPNPPFSRKAHEYYLDSGIILHQYKNLTIKSKTNTAIISDNSYDNILSFKNCKNIRLENISIFHTPSTCNGSVLSLISSKNMAINNCALNGSGGVGATIIGCTNIQFNEVAIFNNVFNAIYSFNASSIEFRNCNLYENHDWGKALINSNFSSMTFNQCTIENNESNLLLFSFPQSFGITNFNNCTISNNLFSDPQEKNQPATKRISKKEKRKIIIKTFLDILKGELNSDHDNSNEELVSFFKNVNSKPTKDNLDATHFMSYYYKSKQESYEISDYQFINKYSVLIDNKLVWKFCFDKNNKIKRIKIFKKKINASTKTIQG